MKLIMDLKKHIRSIKDYPKKGILFRDISTLIKDEKAFSESINQIVERSKKIEFNRINLIHEINIYSLTYKRRLSFSEIAMHLKRQLASDYSTTLNNIFIFT